MWFMKQVYKRQITTDTKSDVSPLSEQREKLLNDCEIICLFPCKGEMTIPLGRQGIWNSRLFRIFLHEAISNIFCRQISLQFYPRVRFSRSTTDG